MKISSTSARLKQLMKEYGLRQIDILEKCKPFSEKYCIRLAKNDLSQYVSGKVEPGTDKLTVLGLALNVNEAWLLGYDVPMGRNVGIETEAQNAIQQCYGNETSEMIDKFLKLDEADRTRIIERIETLLEDDKYSAQEESKHA